MTPHGTDNRWLHNWIVVEDRTFHTSIEGLPAQVKQVTKLFCPGCGATEFINFTAEPESPNAPATDGANGAPGEPTDEQENKAHAAADDLLKGLAREPEPKPTKRRKATQDEE